MAGLGDFVTRKLRNVFQRDFKTQGSVKTKKEIFFNCTLRWHEEEKGKNPVSASFRYFNVFIY